VSPMLDRHMLSSVRISRWLRRTPVHTFVICPLLVVGFELVLNHGRLSFLPWGVPLLAWGYLQYRLVGNYRLPRAGGTAGMDAMPHRVIATGPYRYTRNPMYLGHLVFMAGLVLTFRSWFAVILLTTRGIWFQRRVLQDEARLERMFGSEYSAYRLQVKRWIPLVTLQATRRSLAAPLPQTDVHDASR
jgi:protein-S-isoprenylcysteine O-methyltransferase Ste14